MKNALKREFRLSKIDVYFIIKTYFFYLSDPNSAILLYIKKQKLLFKLLS